MWWLTVFVTQVCAEFEVVRNLSDDFVTVRNESGTVVYLLVSSECRHIHIEVFARNTCLPVCGFACRLDLKLTANSVNC